MQHDVKPESALKSCLVLTLCEWLYCA